MIKKQNGFLSLITIALIVVTGFLAIAITFMLVGSSTGVINFQLSAKAFYIAEGGLEEATRALLTPTLSGSATRIACGSLTGNSNLTNTSLGAGTFTVTTFGSSPIYTNSTLSSAITNSATTIPLTSAAGFSSTGGRVIIDREAINYAAVSGNSLIGATRGADFTIATPHASGVYASQYQCNINSKVGIPTIAAANNSRQLEESIELQEAWAGGYVSGNNFVMTHWNSPTELQWTNANITNATNKSTINGISLLSHASGWAVANVVGGKFIFLQLAGTTWNVVTLNGACTLGTINNLLAVSSVSSSEAWAVGTTYPTTGCILGNNRYNILKYNGTAWAQLAPTTIPADSASNQTLNAVQVVNTNGGSAGNLGFAVGNGGVILDYNGSTWVTDSKSASLTTQNLLGVTIISSTEAWAVGGSGVILKWNGTTWSTFSSPTTTQLNAIVMQSTNGTTATSGWAVGNAGTAITYNGTSWSSSNIGGTNSDLTVAMFGPNDVWAGDTGGNTMHWNGSTWTNITSNAGSGITAMDIIAPLSQPFSAWQEIFP